MLAMGSYVYPTSLAIRSGAAARSRERINNDTINLAHFLFPSRSPPFRAGGEPREGKEGMKQLKSGVRLERACYDRARTFIIFLPDLLKRPARSPRHPCRTLRSTPSVESSLFFSHSLPLSFPPYQTSRVSLVEISLFLFSRGFARGDKSVRPLFQRIHCRPGLKHSVDRAKFAVRYDFVFRRIWE